MLDLNGVVKGRTVDDALALRRRAAGSRPAATSRRRPVVVGLPGGDAVTLHGGGLATSSVGAAPLAARRRGASTI